MIPLTLVAYITSIGASLLIAWLSHWIAILIGYPFTGLMRKLASITKNDTIDVRFITIIGSIVDGFLCIVVAFLFFKMFNAKLKIDLLFILGIAKLIYLVKRHNLTSAKSQEIMEEVFYYFFYIGGLACGAWYVF